MQSNKKRIIIIRCGALGDLVYTTSVIDALIFEFGNEIEIDFVSTPSFEKLFEFDTRVNKVLLLKHRKIPVFLSPQKKEIIKYSISNPYDILINLETGKQFKSLVEKIVAKKKVGWFFENIRSSKKHVVDIYKEFYKSIISKENLNKAYPKIFGEDFQKIKEKFYLPDDYIVISPSTSHNKKKFDYRFWGYKNWSRLLNLFSKNQKLIMIGAKGDDDFLKPLKPYSKNVVDLVGITNIPELISIISNAKAIVVGDTGTAHIASAVNTPIFCLFGPTPSWQNGPYKTPFNKVNIISLNMQCSPCYNTQAMKNCKDNICMKNIQPEFVYEFMIKKGILKFE